MSMSTHTLAYRLATFRAKGFLLTIAWRFFTGAAAAGAEVGALLSRVPRGAGLGACGAGTAAAGAGGDAARPYTKTILQ